MSVSDAAGAEDTAIALNIIATLADGTTGPAETSLFLVDEGSDSILKIGVDGAIEVVVSQDEIKAATGERNADMDDRGIEIDNAGNIYFSEKGSDSILMKPAGGGDLQVVVSKSQIAGVTGTSSNHADPKSLTIGADGKVYIMDDKSNSIIAYDPSDGSVDLVAGEQTLEAFSAISAVDLKGDIVTSPNGTLYFVSDGKPNAVMAIDPATGDASIVASGTPFDDLDVYMTVAPNGDLIVADDGRANTIYRVEASSGDVSVFLSEPQIEAAAGQGVDLEGGISFDAEGNFYLAEENSDAVLVWTADDAAAGTIDTASGEVFVSRDDLQAVTGADADLEAGLTFGAWGIGDALAIVIAGVPAGAELSSGSDNGDGSWTLSSSQLAGLTITPAADDDSDFSLTVTVSTVDENGDTLTTLRTLDVEVTGVADAPQVSLSDATGAEDTAIALDISAALTDSSETLGISISGVPAGATLSAGSDNGDGSWTLSANQLAGLTITPPPDDSRDFSLTVTAISSEDGTTALSLESLLVTVSGVADLPRVTVADVTGAADSAIALDVSASLTDVSENLNVSIAGLPRGALLAAGNQVFLATAGHSVADVSGWDLAALTITPPSGDDSDFTLSVTATSVEPDGGDAASATADLEVSVIEAPQWGTPGDDEISGGKGDDLIDALAGDDFVWGGKGDDELYGNLGDDDLAGGKGDDVLDGGSGDDALDGGKGEDILYGGSGDDVLAGRSGEDILYGGDGDDELSGGSGEDILYGGAGVDVLRGGGGDDTFRFEALDELGDSITDFRSGHDKLAFDSDAFNIEFDLATGRIADDAFIGVEDFDAESSDLSTAFVFDQSSHELYFDQSGVGEGYTLVANIEDGELDIADILMVE